MHRTSILLVALSAALLAACGGSSSDDAGSQKAAPAGIPAVFADYCTGTLLVDREGLRPSGAGSWEGQYIAISAGSTFLLDYSLSRWNGGYVFDPQGAPTQIDAAFTKGLVLGTDFSSDCVAPGSVGAKNPLVILQRSTVYAAKDLSGSPCEIPAGTAFDGYGFSSVGDVATFQASGLAGLCGFEQGYSKDLVFGKLVRK